MIENCQRRRELKAGYTLLGLFLCAVIVLGVNTLRSTPETEKFVVQSFSGEVFRRLDDVDECNDRHPEFCAMADDDSGCFVKDLLDGACCVNNPSSSFLQSSNNTFAADLLDFNEGKVVCINKEDGVCLRKDMCVAELIPGQAKGALCLSGFELTASSGLIVYLLVLAYLFLGLAIVCDDYFAYSLDQIASLYDVSPDVKGATFAAAGSSAPELFVALADNVFSNPPQSVGLGAVLGSCIFNILCIIGFSSIIAQRFDGLAVAWRPFLRDSMFYLLAVLALIGVILEGDVSDNKVFWWEGFIFVCIYAVYVFTMIKNEQFMVLLDKVTQRLPWMEKPVTQEIVPKKEGEEEEVEFEVMRAISYESFMSARTKHSFQSNIGGGRIAMSVRDEEDAKSGIERDYWENLRWPKYVPEDHEFDDEELSFSASNFGGGLSMWIRRMYFLLVFPLNLLFRCTVPDSKFDIFGEDKDGVKNKRVKAYYVEFAISIVYLGIFCQGLVFTASKFGCIAGISPSVMGLTFLAVGTSIPDCLTGMHLAALQEGDASVADALGSNIFDILFGLGLPWMLAGFIYGNTEVNLNDVDIVLAFMFAVFFLLIFGLFSTGFRLNAKLGYLLVSAYILYLVLELFVL